MTHQEQPNLKQIKFEAKRLKKKEGIQHADALEEVSKEYGFKNWYEANKNLKSPAYPFSFVMGRHDAGWDFPSGFIEDEELFDEWFAKGINKGMSEPEVGDLLSEYAFIKHKTEKPKTARQAVEIIRKDFFFPPITIWLDNIEFCEAADDKTGKGIPVT